MSTFHIKSRAILLTYNGLSLDSLDAFTELIQNSPCWGAIARWSLCMEEASSLHFHAFLEGEKQLDHELSNWELLGVTPNCQCNSVKGSGARPSLDRGHFYVACRFKTSSLDHSTNYHPAQDYVVKSQWLLNLFCTQKVTGPNALNAAADYGTLTKHFEDQITRSDDRMRHCARIQKKRERQEALVATYTAYKVYPQQIEFLEQFLHLKGRYKFFIIWGEESGLGKSDFAKSLFENPFLHDNSISWAGYDDEVHDGIIFDDVHDIYRYVSHNRNLFQARGEVKVNTSATNCYAMSIDVTQKPIIVTTNYEPTNPWVEQNSIVLEVDKPTFETPPP